MKKQIFIQDSMQAKLAKIKLDLAAKEKALALAQKAKAQALKTQHEAASLLQKAYEGTTKLPNSTRVALPTSLPTKRDTQQKSEFVQSTLSDLIDIDTLLDTDESLSFRRDHIGIDILKKLRRGEWAINAELDLHGLRSDEAREAVNEFIIHAKQKCWRCIRIIHGKGLGSKNREAVLKDKVKAWLIQKNEVLAFCQAKPSDGGAGAVIVLLSAKK